MISSPSDSGRQDPVAPQADRASVGRGDAAVVAMASAGWVGADLGWPALEPRSAAVVAAIVTVAALARRRPWLLVVACFLLCSHLGARADAGHRPVRPGPLRAAVTVLGDVERVGAGSRLEVRLPTGERIEATAHGRAGTVFERASIGESLRVEGRLRPAGDRGWLRSRHITGLASVDQAEIVGPGSIRHRIPEFVRHRIAAGADGLAPERASLYLGLVIGDDRHQTLGQRLRFRASGLTHLLAVSGQNVAFVLAVVGPLLRSLGYRGRFVGLLAILVLFALITRLEPSVLRATATASIAAWATLTGRDRSGVRILSLAVLALVCADPFLVDSVGFQLSVAASGGILVLQPAIDRRLPGPAWLTVPVSTTLAAQLAVSPLLGHYFGPISLASIPANLLAGWAAAGVMTIGLTVGVLAGLAPDPLADLLQAPAAGLLWWIELVATVHARLPAPRVGPVTAIGLCGVGLALRSPVLGLRSRVVAGAMVALLLVAAVPRATEPSRCGHAMVWLPGAGAGSSPDRAGPAAAVLVLGADASERSVEACVDAGVRTVDLLVVERGSAPSARLVAAVEELMVVAEIVAPPKHRVIGARRLLEPRDIRTSPGLLTITPAADGRSLELRLAPDR